jgi:hypothetical protein
MAVRILASPKSVHKALLTHLEVGDEAKANMAKLIDRKILKDRDQNDDQALDTYRKLSKDFLELYVAFVSSIHEGCPLNVLHATLTAIVAVKSCIAYFIVSQMFEAIDNAELEYLLLSLHLYLTRQFECSTHIYKWELDEFTARFIFVLAASKKNIGSAHDFFTIPPSIEYVSSDAAKRPTFRGALVKAKSQANKGKTTVICVRLIDIHSLQIVSENMAKNECISFTHNFVIGIGPQGSRIWQACGEQTRAAGQEARECTLAGWIARKRTQLRKWQYMNLFCNKFEELTSTKVLLL